MERFHEIQALIERAMISERHRLRRKFQRVSEAQQAGKPFDRNLEQILDEATKSSELAERRRDALPAIKYPDDLPIVARREEIAEAIAEHQVVIVCGETGSGKSTQLPKICLELGRGVFGTIGHTQPRRIAARSVASRVADELGTPVGKQVGFKIRFTDATDEATHIKLMTDGVLLAETQSDRFLNQYDTLIIDEAHERSLNIDFLLGYLKQLLPKRPELKLIITSATIDAERFAEHFGTGDEPAPVIMVSGRSYPVETRYRSLVDLADEGETEADMIDGIRAGLQEITAWEREQPAAPGGDVLVFLPTERDIREVARQLRNWRIAGDPVSPVEVLPLYGRLSQADQDRVFKPHPGRRIVLATNVAESSLTVPGIRTVIDTGTVRISRYSPHQKMQRLPIEPISQASAEQRTGRCGRLSPGLCLRLYSQQDFESRERFTPPEILRTNLAAVILQLKSLRLGDVDAFPFLDSPKPAAIADGYKTLFEIGALNDRKELTETGKTLSRLPVDPRIGRMILEADRERCLREVLIIAGALELQDPRERPAERQAAADSAHEKFKHERSDFLSYLKLWDYAQDLRDKLSQNQFRKRCAREFLSYTRLREWFDIVRQLRELAESAKLSVGKRATRMDDRFDEIHRSLLSGLLSNVASLDERGRSRNIYRAGGGKELVLWPGSGLFERKPKWTVASEVVETSRRYLRTVAEIQPDWIEPLAKHLVKLTHGEPYWSAKSASAIVDEQATLFGLVIVPRRPTRLGSFQEDRPLARQWFIRHALVQREWKSRSEFLEQNAQVRERVRQLQAKSRGAEVTRGDDAVFDFYDRILPADATDGHRFDQWRKRAERADPSVLHLSEADLLTGDAATVSERDYPNHLTIGKLAYPLEYHLEPGADEDGVTLRIPREVLNQLDPRRLQWLVPGLVEEKIAALVKTLPKSLRTPFVPVPQSAKELAEAISFGKGDLHAELAERLGRIAGQPISARQFSIDQLPRHLRMNVRVVDREGRTLAQGRELGELRKELAQSADEAVAETVRKFADPKWTRDGIKSWDFGEIPRELNITQQKLKVTLFPALIDQTTAVGTRAFDTPERADWETHAAVRRLFLLGPGREIHYAIDRLAGIDAMRHAASVMGGKAVFNDQFAGLIAERCLFPEESTELPRDEAAFKKMTKHARSRMGVAIEEATPIVSQTMTIALGANRELAAASGAAIGIAVRDMKSQFARLIHAKFLTETPWPWLYQYPRYLRGIRERLRKLKTGGQIKDVRAMQMIEPHWRRYQELQSALESQHRRDARLDYLRWLIEEYRIELFAHNLKTAVPVSEKRLEEQWGRVDA